MTLAPEQYRVLTGIEPRSYDNGKDGGEIVLTWQTSRKVTRSVEIMPDRFEDVIDVEPAEVVETKSYATTAELQDALDRFRSKIYRIEP